MLYEDDSDMVFDSVRWDDGPPPAGSTSHPRDTSNANGAASSSHPTSGGADLHRSSSLPSSKSDYYLVVEVKEPQKMLEGTKDTYISYLCETRTNLPHFRPLPSTAPRDGPQQESFHSVRRRFQDFAFLRNTLAREWPSCVVPPIPDKHRLAYVAGDRFGPEFIEKRALDLQRFMTRLSRHPRLSRTPLVRSFLDSTEWNVTMHQHSSSYSSSSHNGADSTEGPSSLYDSITDSVINVFAKVRKPDERFVEMKDRLDKWEEGLLNWERVEGRRRTRISDMANDYDEFAASIQGLGFLESGITEPLAAFENALLEFSRHLKDSTHLSSDALLTHLHALIAYSASFKSNLRNRESKQLDFEELTTYLSTATAERDRLASGYGGGMGLGGYLKERMEGLTGAGGVENTREGKLGRLDTKIRSLQGTVTQAHEASDRFNEDMLSEGRLFDEAKRIEMKEMLGNLAESQIEMYKKAIEDWDRCIPALERIRVDS